LYVEDRSHRKESLKTAQPVELAVQCGACYQHTVSRNVPRDRCSLIILCIIIYLSCYCPYWLHWSRFWTSRSLHRRQLSASNGLRFDSVQEKERKGEKERTYQLKRLQSVS